MKNNTKEKGITLIALIVTIIVLLILAGVTIISLTGENGILGKSTDAKLKREIAKEIEQIKLSVNAVYTNYYDKGYLPVSELKKELQSSYEGIEEVKETSDIEGATKVSKAKKKMDLGSMFWTESIAAENGDGDTEPTHEFAKITYTSKREYYVKIKNVTGGNSDPVGTIYSKGGTTEDNTITNTGVDVDEIFDETGTEEGKLHIGDFINYSAGTWTSADMNTIANTGVAPNNLMRVPSSTDYQFGGFAVDGSRDGNAIPYYAKYNYVKDKDEKAITGWRLFDVSDDGVMTLISAGCPEDYYHPNGSNTAYISEYILTGNVNSNADATSLGLGTTYKARNWNMYVNSAYRAESASVLTKAKLDEWYIKYTNTPSADTYIKATFQKIYKTDTNCVNNGMYESLIDNYSKYWLSAADDGDRNSVYGVYPETRLVTHFGGAGSAFGVRVLVSLSSDVKLSDEATDTKTVVSRSNEYTYNVWDLVTK